MLKRAVSVWSRWKRQNKALTQVNRTSEQAAEGERIIVPRHLVPIAVPSLVSSYAPTGR